MQHSKKNLFNFLLSTYLVLLITSCVEHRDMSIKAPEVTSFMFEKSKNPQLPHDIEMEIFNTSKKISGYLKQANIDLTSLKPTFKTARGAFYVNNIQQESGITANDFTGIVKYTCKGDNDEDIVYEVALVPYTGLPVARIYTEQEASITTKEVWTKAYIEIDGMGIMDSMKDSATVKGRGNGSWAFPKKPFNLKLSTKQEVLGMPKQKNWAFLANYRDRTLLRNNVTFHIGTMTDNLLWTPRSQFVEVILNGEYQGNFQICERIRVDKNRVNMKEMSSEDIDDETVTGGYIIEYTRYDEVNKFKSPINNWPVAVKEPDEDVLVPTQLEYIKQYTNKIEELLVAGKFTELYEEYIDLNSFVDYWIVQTLVGNAEIASYGSVYCTKDRNAKMYAGPIWDFDFSTYTSTSGVENKNTIWYKFMFKDRVFKDKIKERFSELKPQFETVPQYIRSQSEYLAESAEQNWKKWPINIAKLNGFVNKDESLPYQGAIDSMIALYLERLVWFEGVINKL